MSVAATFSAGITKHPGMSHLLGVDELILNPTAADVDRISFVVGWGLKSNTTRARAFAREHGLDYQTLEDGFVRSVGLGVEGALCLSIVVDDRGVYYDGGRPSALEAMLESGPAGELEALSERAQACIERMRRARITKYNDGLSRSEDEIERTRERVLVIDQTAGDLSVQHGQLAEGGIPGMLEAAYAENPEAEIWIKAHPDVIAGARKGHLTPSTVPPSEERRERTRWIVDRGNPWDVLEQVDRVYVASSQMGFEALLAGKRVECFGMPFYAGWGLTRDRVQCERRSRTRSLEEVFAAAYLRYARYWVPGEVAACELEDVLAFVELQLDTYRKNRGRFFCFGMSRWKRHWVRDYLESPSNEVRFFRSLRSARRAGLGKVGGEADGQPQRVLVWGQRLPTGLEAFCRERGVAVWRMEDGFLRSVGLGSDLTRASSVVVDTRGIYYDPNQASDLEVMLQETQCDAATRQRARDLISLIVESRVSKYNLTQGQQPGRQARGWGAEGQKVILVPGQVEDDASILLGAGEVRTNLGLIAAVRKSAPEAFIVFKPHPDVVSGNRKGAVPEEEARRLCDEVVLDLPLPACLDLADEVHTMTSLVGFEALLRGLRVTCYGAPFYAGWGLTRDMRVTERRTRTLTLEELVAGALINYPRYLSSIGNCFTTPERVVAQLQRASQSGGAVPIRASRASRWLGQLGQLAKGIFRA